MSYTIFMIRRDIKITEMIKNKLKELEQNGLINIAYALNSYNFGFIILDSNDRFGEMKKIINWADTSYQGQ